MQKNENPTNPWSEVFEARNEVRFSIVCSAILGLGTLVIMFLFALDGDQIGVWIGLPVTVVLSALNIILFCRTILCAKTLGQKAVDAATLYSQEVNARLSDRLHQQSYKIGKQKVAG